MKKHKKSFLKHQKFVSSESVKNEIVETKIVEKNTYRPREKPKKSKMTLAERQKSFEKKQKKDGLKRVSFWLTKEDLKIIDQEQKMYADVHRMKLNKSKVLGHILRRFKTRY